MVLSFAWFSKGNFSFGGLLNQKLFGGSKKLTKKGFIGPIGDDLPSLVPIVIALLLFFTIFALTLSSYNTKNDLVSKQIEMTSVARLLKGDSLLLDVNQFAIRCSNLRIKKLPNSFMAGIYSSDVNINDVLSDFVSVSTVGVDPSDEEATAFLKQELLDSTKQAYFCNYNTVGGQKFSPSKKNYLLRFYPVAVQYPRIIDGETHYLIVPALMAMIFWE